MDGMAPPELVLLVPQKVIESIGGDDGQLRVRLDQVERAERLRRDLRNLLSRDSVRSLSAEEWMAAVRRLMDAQKEETAPALTEERRLHQQQQWESRPYAPAGAWNKELLPPATPPPPDGSWKGGEEEEELVAGGWRHLDRCKILAPEFLR